MKICIVEDNQILSENLRLLLQGEPDIQVTGICGSAEEALETTDWNETDILLADMDLPGMSGVDLIKCVKSTYPRVEVLAYTVCEDRSVVMSAIRSGASGYLLKGSTPRVLIESLRELHEGGAPMTPKIARKLMVEFRLQNAPADGSEPQGDLTHREIEIMRNLEKGLSYAEIAEQLKISPHTVHTHIKNIYEKIQAQSRADMLRKARRLGVI
jgi:two-component system NarL family response regulator